MMTTTSRRKSASNVASLILKMGRDISYDPYPTSQDGEKTMIPPFTEALADLLAKYCDHPIEDLIVAMERALEGLHDDEKFQTSERRDDGGTARDA